MLRGSAALLVLSSTSLSALLGCHHGEPPAPVGIDAAVAPLPPPPGASAAGPSEPAASSRPATAQMTPPSVDADAGADPGALPQTKDRPEAAGAAYEARIAALWEGIAKDDPERAMPFFFPLTAYEQVKAITNAGSDWRRRLVAAYKRDIHALHKRLGEHPESVKFLRAEVPQDRARWVEPNEESNKLGYHRVYGTRLVFELDGKERSFEVTSLIAWRGEWYVVHLTGFK